MHEGFTVAIDGPVASGKGTVAPQLANELNGFHIYTGGTYRAAALYCLDHNINPNDTESVTASLNNILVDLTDEGVFLNGKNVTEELTRREVANASSPVSVIKEVRKKMVDVQREIAQREMKKGKAVIAEGRDTGTNVFPNADLKVFLTATPECRAKRRQEQYLEKGEEVSLETVLEEINERDFRDTNRDLDPLSSNPELQGYFVIDNSEQMPEKTLEVIMEELRKRELI